MTKIYLLIGSNMGERITHLSQASDKIQREIGHITAKSRIYGTQPWGVTQQADFLNQALEVETSLSPHDVLTKIHAIEDDLGRIRGDKWAERVIDIDILLFSNKIINEPNLQIPHAHLHERNFALIPLMDIAGEFEHPVLKQNIEDIYFDNPDTLEVYEYEAE